LEGQQQYEAAAAQYGAVIAEEPLSTVSQDAAMRAGRALEKTSKFAEARRSNHHLLYELPRSSLSNRDMSLRLIMLIEKLMLLVSALAVQSATAQTAAITSDHVLQAQRTMRAAIGDYEAEVSIEVTYMTETQEINGRSVEVPRDQSKYDTKRPGRYRWRESGKRFHSQVLKFETGTPGYRQSHAFDGMKYQLSNDPERRSGIFKSGNVEEMDAVRNMIRDRCPLSLVFYNESQPLLGGEKYTVVENGGYVPFQFEVAKDFELLDHYRVLKMSANLGRWHKMTKDSPVDQAFFRANYLHSCWWVDPDVGWMPRRVEGYNQDKMLAVRFDIFKYKKVEEGVWFPLEGEITLYALDAKGDVTPSVKKKILVDDNTIKTKQVFDNSKFELDWPIGARIRDDDVGQSFTYGVPASEPAK
jgi:hypothetical protein